MILRCTDEWVRVEVSREVNLYGLGETDAKTQYPVVLSPSLKMM